MDLVLSASFWIMLCWFCAFICFCLICQPPVKEHISQYREEYRWPQGNSMHRPFSLCSRKANVQKWATKDTKEQKGEERNVQFLFCFVCLFILTTLNTKAEADVSSALIWWKYWLVSVNGAAVALLPQEPAIYLWSSLVPVYPSDIQGSKQALSSSCNLANH